MSESVFNPWKPTGEGKRDIPMDPPFMDPSLSPRGSQEHQAEEWAATQAGGKNRYGGQGFSLESPSSGKWGPSWF